MVERMTLHTVSDFCCNRCHRETFFHDDQTVGLLDAFQNGVDVERADGDQIDDLCLDAGIEAEIIDLVTIRPLDIDTILESIKKTNRLVIVEESFPVASIATEITYRVQRHAFDHLDAPIRRLCQSDTPFAFSTSLIEEALPQVKDIVEAVKDVAYVA